MDKKITRYAFSLLALAIALTLAWPLVVTVAKALAVVALFVGFLFAVAVGSRLLFNKFLEDGEQRLTRGR